MHYPSIAAAAAILFALPQAALAQKDREQAEQVFRVTEAPKGEHEYKQGDYLLRVPLVWARAAVLSEAVTVTAGARSETIAAGSVLPEETLLEAENSKTFFTAYCTPRKAAERVLDKGVGAALFGGSLNRKLIRDMSDAQFCLADRDGDGRLEQSLLVGDGWGDARSPHSIAPVAYEKRDDAPISPNDEVRFHFAKAGRSEVTFVLEILQQGKLRGFETIGGERRVRALPTGKSLPLRIGMYGTEFELVAYDTATKSVRIRWSEAVPAESRIVVSDKLVFHYSF